MPNALRPALEGFIFGCDVCQDVCPLNMTPVKAGARFEPRSVSRESIRSLAAMTKNEFDAWIPGTALARAGFDGLRRNAAYALGAVRDVGAKTLLEKLAADEHPGVREAASWALNQLHG